MNHALQGAKTAIYRSHPPISPSLPLSSTSAFQSVDETLCACQCMISREDEGVREGDTGGGEKEEKREGSKGVLGEAEI